MPGEIPCVVRAHPTAARVIEVLGNLQRHILSAEGGQRVQTFMPEVSELQEKTLGLLGITVKRFLAGLD